MVEELEVADGQISANGQKSQAVNLHRVSEKDRSLDEIRQMIRENSNSDSISMIDNAEAMEEAEARHDLGPVSYTHLTLPTNREV